MRDARKRWDRNARWFDWMTALQERAAYVRETKREMLGGLSGRILELGAGTGNNFKFYAPEARVIAVDLSGEMLSRARIKGAGSSAKISLIQADIECLPFADATFDTVVSTCVFCSVSDPVSGLSETRRVLASKGLFHLFEHVLSKNPVLAFFMNLMNPMARLIGPEINRDTASHLKRVGLNIFHEKNVRYDIFKRFDARRSDTLES